MVSFFAFWTFLLVKMYFPQDSVFGRTRANIQKELYIQFVNATVGSVLNSQAVAEGRTGSPLFSANERSDWPVDTANQTLGVSDLANQTFGWPESADTISDWPDTSMNAAISALSNQTSGWSEEVDYSSEWDELANDTAG
jgi:hypothetical protein